MAKQGGGKSKGSSGRAGGPWQGGPKRGKPNQPTQPTNPRQTRDANASASGGRGRNRPVRDDDAAPAEMPSRPPASAGTGGFAKAGRSQPGKPGQVERVRGDAPKIKPWANRPAADRRAERTRQGVENEQDRRTATPLAPRRSERSEMRPPRELIPSVRGASLPRSPAPIGGQTPLERRRAYRYGGEVAVDRDALYGRNAVAEALRAGRRKVRRVSIAEGTDDHRAVTELAALAQSRSVEVEFVARTEIERRAPGVNHQGVVAEVAPYPYTEYDDLLDAMRGNPTGLLLVLDSLQDPQNLGTLLRTAEAANVTGIVIPEHRAVQVTPAVVNASAGAVEHLPVAMVTNLVRAVEQAKEAGAWAVAAEGVPDAVLPADADLTGPIVLVIGSEGQGVGRLLRETCDLTVRIPLVGKVGSLNAATAGSILLYEIVRQRAEAIALAAFIAAEGQGE